jgi:hypothetical protein
MPSSTLQIGDKQPIEVVIPASPFAARRVYQTYANAERVALEDYQRAAAALDAARAEGSELRGAWETWTTAQIVYTGLSGYLLHVLCALDTPGTVEDQALAALDYVIALGYDHEEALALASCCADLLLERMARAPDLEKVRKLRGNGIRRSDLGTSCAKTSAGVNLEADTLSMTAPSTMACVTG